MRRYCRPTGFGSFCSSTQTEATASTIGAEKASNPVLTQDEDRYVTELLAGLDAFPACYWKMGNVAANVGATPAQTLAKFRGHLRDRTSPPGPVDTWIGEIVIHGADIRGPLGIRQQTPIPTVRRVADFYQGSNLIVGAKHRIAGLTLRATDTDWIHGAGPEVSGPLLPLVLAMTGRRAALTDLTGDGVEVLATRMP